MRKHDFRDTLPLAKNVVPGGCEADLGRVCTEIDHLNNKSCFNGTGTELQTKTIPDLITFAR